MLQRKLKHNFTCSQFSKKGFARVRKLRMRFQHPVILLTVSCFYRTHQGENSFTNGKVFFTSNYWNVSKQYFFTILFPRQLTRNRNVRNSLLLWKTNGTYCTYLIEGQVNIKSMHCKSNCNQYHHIYIQVKSIIVYFNAYI